MSERSHYARGEQDVLIVAQGGIQHPAEIMPRQLAAQLRIEDLLTEIRDLLAAQASPTKAPRAPKVDPA